MKWLFLFIFILLLIAAALIPPTQTSGGTEQPAGVFAPTATPTMWIIRDVPDMPTLSVAPRGGICSIDCSVVPGE